MTKLETASTPVSATQDGDFCEIDIQYNSTAKHGVVLIDFHSDFDSPSFRTVECDKTSTALTVLQEYFADAPDGNCSNWAIFECRQSQRMRRFVEDHEMICDIRDNWQSHSDGEFNRFVIKQNFCKYEVFRNPMQFFPAGMLSLPSAKADMLAGLPTDAQNSYLRGYLAVHASQLEMEGWMYVMEKKNWKKQYLIIRPSGLYTSINKTSKEPQYLSLVCGLEDVNIYNVDGERKSLSAPTEFVICLSGIVNEEVFHRFLCVDEEDIRRNWTVALRLQKFGHQLRENYLAAIRVDKALKMSHDVRELHLEEDLKSRVAMDFSGQSGRIVRDEHEAIEALVSEVQSWRKRKSLRSADCSPSSSPSETGLYFAQCWYHGTLSREAATQLLTRTGLVDGESCRHCKSCCHVL